MEEKGKEDGWNQAKRSKTSHRKNTNGKAKTPQEGIAHKLARESQGNKFEILGFEIMTTQETKAPKEISAPKVSPSIKIIPKRTKEKASEEEEETQEFEESKEEGEIGES